MSDGDDVIIRRNGHAGCVTMNRPGALNALTHDMALAIESALNEWRADDEISTIVFDGNGERAFCAGGDIERLYESGKAGDYAYGRRFWTDEYRLNALIADYEKPVVAFMHGFVMGGGVGIGCHARHRIVDDTTRIAMPECGIGLVPDVGGSLLLARAPGRAGWYLGATGARMEAADAIHAGFADLMVPGEAWPALKKELAATGDPACLAAHAVSPGASALAAEAAAIERHFSADNALDCLASLEAGGSQWAEQAAKTIRRGCPLSVACTHELLTRNALAASVREAVEMELRFTWRSMSDGEFLEGVRAQIIDRDREPKWRISRLEDVTAQAVAAMLAPIDGRE